MDKENLFQMTSDFLRQTRSWSQLPLEKFQDLDWGDSTEVPRVSVVKIRAKHSDGEISRMLPRGHCFSSQEFYRLIVFDLAKHSEGQQGVILNDDNAKNEMGLHFYVDLGECSNVPLFVVFAEFIPQRKMWFFERYDYDDGVEWVAGSIFVVRIE